MSLCNDALIHMCVVMSSKRDDYDINETYLIENQIDAMYDSLKAANIEAVNEQEYDYVVGTIFDDLVSELERLGDYIVNVMQARLGVKG